MYKGIEERTQYSNEQHVPVTRVLAELAKKFGIQVGENMPDRSQIETMFLVCYQRYHHCTPEQVAVQVWRCLLDVRDFLYRGELLPRYVMYAYENIPNSDGSAEKELFNRIITLSLIPEHDTDYIQKPHLVNRLPSAIRAGYLVI